MKFSTAVVVSLVATLSAIAPITHAQNTMVKMCLFYPNPSGHARSDPIINQNCASGHVHTVSSSVYHYHVILFPSLILSFLTHNLSLLTPLLVLRSTKFSSKYKLRGYQRYSCSFQFESLGRKPISLLASYHL